MSDIDTNPPSGAGFEEWPEMQHSKMPDFGSMVAKRMAQTQQAAPAPTSGFDPHKMMVQKHKVETGEVPVEVPDAPKWPEEDIKALQDYCAKMGIVGFSTRQNPKLALAQLKQQIGDMSDIPLERRVPFGYEKRGTLNSHNCNFPYSKVEGPKKSLLSG